MVSSTRFSIYRQFKHCFEREYYVDVIWINSYRNALAQFRMGVSQINTHKYRYSKLPEEINCPFCENTHESEIHFLLHCPVYRNVRTRYLVNYNRNISDQEHKTQESILGMAKFLFFALQLRLKKMNDNSR